MSKLVTDTMMGSIEVEWEITHGLLIGNMTFNRPRSRSQDFLIQYLEYEDRYNDGLKRRQIRSYQWAFD